MRAGPPGWVTAANWSAASSAPDRFGCGDWNRPCSICTACTTGTPSTGSLWRIGPPSIHTGCPSGVMMSPGVSAPQIVAPMPTATSTTLQRAASVRRASIEFDQIR